MHADPKLNEIAVKLNFSSKPRNLKWKFSLPKNATKKSEKYFYIHFITLLIFSDQNLNLTTVKGDQEMKGREGGWGCSCRSPRMALIYFIAIVLKVCQQKIWKQHINIKQRDIKEIYATNNYKTTRFMRALTFSVHSVHPNQLYSKKRGWFKTPFLIILLFSPRLTYRLISAHDPLI